MRVAFAVIIGVLAFYVYKWWLGTKSSYVPKPTRVAVYGRQTRNFNLLDKSK